MDNGNTDQLHERNINILPKSQNCVAILSNCVIPDNMLKGIKTVYNKDT